MSRAISLKIRQFVRSTPEYGVQRFRAMRVRLHAVFVVCL
jgi:hypothetical protein